MCPKRRSRAVKQEHLRVDTNRTNALTLVADEKNHSLMLTVVARFFTDI